MASFSPEGLASIKKVWNWQPIHPQETKLITLLALLLPATILITMWFDFGRKNKFPVKGRLVVVTGGSQGMGKAVCKDLAKKGASIAIIARDETKLKGAVEEVKASAQWPEHQRFKAFSADMTKHTEIKRVLEEIKAWAGVPDIVWQIHGASVPAYFKDCTPELLESQMSTNYLSVMHLAHAAINMMVDNPQPADKPNRQIVFTSSVVAFYNMAGYNVYGPAKAALRALADGLHQECLLYGIDVKCCFPGGIQSPGYVEENKTKPELLKILEASDVVQEPELVSSICIDKLEKGHTFVITGFLPELLRAGQWGGTKRSNLLFDSFVACITQVVWWFVKPEMDGKVTKYLKANGIPPKKIVG